MSEGTEQTYEICSHIAGRSGFSSYPLLEEAMKRYDLSAAVAHDAISAYVQQLVELDGPGVVLDERQVDPGPNHNDRDVYWWMTISAESAETVRQALAEDYTQA